MPDMPTAPCCEPVVASVDLGGGVPCLCRVAAQPQLVLARLNASHLLALYTACGGLRTGGAHLAAACQGPSLAAAVPVITPPPPAAPRHKLPARAGVTLKCNSSLLALRLQEQCTLQSAVPPPGCCSAVRDTVDDPDRGCLCSVGDTYEFAVGSLDIYTVWTLYRTCGAASRLFQRTGRAAHMRRRLPLRRHRLPPPRQPKPSSPPPHETRRPSRLSGTVLAGYVLGGVVVVVTGAVVVVGGLLVYKALAGVRGDGIARRLEAAPPELVLPAEAPGLQLQIPAAHDPPVVPTTSSSSSSNADVPSSSSSGDKAHAKDLEDKNLVGKNIVPYVPFVPAVTNTSSAQ